MIPPQRRPRRLSLDALRGIAVLLMIEQHLGVWLWEGPRPGEGLLDHPWLVGFNALGGLAAPAFIVLAGVGSSLLAASRDDPDRTFVLRGLTVLGLGYLLSAATPSWFSWRSWFVLHLMGLGIAAMPALRRSSTGALYAAAAVILAATPLVQAWLPTPMALSNERMAGVLAAGRDGFHVLPGGHARLALAEGHFPVLPWLAAFVLGVVGGRLVAQERPRAILWLGGACLLVGGALLGAGAVAGTSGPGPLARALRFTAPFFPASPAEVLALVGVVVVSVGVAVRLDPRYLLGERSVLVVLGRASLSLLLGHVVMFRELTRPLGLWQAMSPGAALATILGFVVLAALGARAWQRVGYRGGAEWLLRQIAP